jgi:hypothetical protein
MGAARPPTTDPLYSPPVPRPTFAAVLALALPSPILAQGPIFLSSPNTMPAGRLLPSLSYAQKGPQNEINLGTGFGLRSNLTGGIGGLLIQNDGGPFRFARLQAQLKYRLWQKVGDGTRSLIGVGTGVAIPAGDFVGQVARDRGVSLLTVGATAAHTNRRTGYYAGGQYSLDAHDGGNRSSGSVGVALSWRPKPALPGTTGGPGLTLFAESLAQYQGRHSGYVALASGFIFRTGETQFRAGLRVPVRRWNSGSRAVLTLGTSTFLRIAS